MRPSAEWPAGPVIYGLPVIRAVAKALAATIAAALLAGCGATVASHAVPVTLPRPATLGDELYRPAGPGPFPAVIVLLMRRTLIPEARGGRGATVEYDARAHGDAERQVRRFLAQHLRP